MLDLITDGYLEVIEAIKVIIKMQMVFNTHSFQTMVICNSCNSEILLPSEKDLYSEDVQHWICDWYKYNKDFRNDV